jgi:signal transduction histidine kinase
VLETGRMQVDPDYRVVDRHGRQRTFVATRLPYWFSAEHPDCVLSVLAEVTELKAVEEEVRQLNAELEDRVTARTAELAAANRELEAFSYTVSHDLRAPARAVAGFSEILLREHAGQLDDEGVRLLRRMSAAGERMGEMIDGLLRLARVSRADLVRAPLDLSAMARHVWEEACGSEPGRTVAFVAQAGVNAHTDPVLMRNVLQNLLANALKYTRPVKDGRVEFGASASGAELVYVVRDNGVGFDMAHAGKLFGVFQRMHGYDEFEGTGVGLATAQRIIGRHGGRIWADARPGQGACFYFTLA